MHINKSAPLNLFKKEIGQSNHMLITIIVGLDGIEKYNVEANPEFHTTWNPKSRKNSVERSKIFAKKSALSWVVDCIDMYFRLINQHPTLICDNELKKSLDDDKNSRSVYLRLKLICNFLAIDSIEYALVDLLICWRNKLTHYQAENDILHGNRTKLINLSKDVNLNYCNIHIEETLVRFDSNDTPTFKEVASLIRATINLIYQIDNDLLGQIDLCKYADETIIKYIKINRQSRLDDIFSKGIETAYRKLIQILFQSGFKEDENNEIKILCDKISKLSFIDAKKKIENGTFID